MAELHNTVMGKKLIEHTLPEIAKQLTRIADSLEAQNSPLTKSLKSLINSTSDDKELGVSIRKLWQN